MSDKTHKIEFNIVSREGGPKDSKRSIFGWRSAESIRRTIEALGFDIGATTKVIQTVNLEGTSTELVAAQDKINVALDLMSPAPIPRRIDHVNGMVCYCPRINER